MCTPMVLKLFFIQRALLCFVWGSSTADLSISRETHGSPWTSAFCAGVDVVPERYLCSALAPAGCTSKVEANGWLRHSVTLDLGPEAGSVPQATYTPQKSPFL